MSQTIPDFSAAMTSGQTILDVEDEIAAQIAMEISNSQRLSGTGTDP